MLCSRFMFIMGAFFSSLQSAFASVDIYPASNTPSSTLHIYGTTDGPLFSSFIRAFQTLNPGIAVRYEELESGAVFNGVIHDDLNPKADLIISSAVDLQMKMANDGYALAYASPYLEGLPDWAHWRDEVFGFTFEPAVIVYNRRLMAADEAPHTHLQLAKLLEGQKQRFMHKVGTYNIATSGVGYVMATHDELISSNFWRLTNAFAAVKAQLSASSPEVLSALESGDIAIAYNLLGSYAFARALINPDLVVIVPDDYTLVLARSAIIPRTSRQPEAAKRFVDFLLSRQGQEIAAGETGFGAIMPEVSGRFTQQSIMKMGQGAFQPIAMTPTLLVAYDHQKRAQFLRVWLDIVGDRDEKDDVPHTIGQRP